MVGSRSVTISNVKVMRLMMWSWVRCGVVGSWVVGFMVWFRMIWSMMVMVLMNWKMFYWMSPVGIWQRLDGFPWHVRFMVGICMMGYWMVWQRVVRSRMVVWVHHMMWWGMMWFWVVVRLWMIWVRMMR